MRGSSSWFFGFGGLDKTRNEKERSFARGKLQAILAARVCGGMSLCKPKIAKKVLACNNKFFILPPL
jgi:hypothetical protein